MTNRHILSLLALSTLPASLCAQNRPNIVLFLVDDMGWQETSVPFWKERTPLNDRYRTPNMERLAQMGVKFTNAYACAVSSPSRCSLMSGMNAARHRVTNWTLHYDQQTDAKSNTINLPDWNYNGIQPADANAHDSKNATRITSLPQVLHDNGYYTIHCGKAHFAAAGAAGNAFFGIEGFEVDDVQSFFKVHCAGCGWIVLAAPVVKPQGHVARLLHFGYHQSASCSVDGSGIDEVALPFLRMEGIEQLVGRAFPAGLVELGR